jgi:AdoMet-dependent rRNA methyltransferase SPB1
MLQDERRVWEPAEVAEFVRKHAATTTEIRHLCTDLQVLGRSEFKQLLRWRMKVRGDILKGEASIRKASAADEV